MYLWLDCYDVSMNLLLFQSSPPIRVEEREEFRKQQNTARSCEWMENPV